jgi:hypothetical protein
MKGRHFGDQAVKFGGSVRLLYHSEGGHGSEILVTICLVGFGSFALWKAQARRHDRQEIFREKLMVNKIRAPVDLCRAVLLVHITRRRAAVVRSLPFERHEHPFSIQRHWWLTRADCEPPVRNMRVVPGLCCPASHRCLMQLDGPRVQLVHWQNGPARLAALIIPMPFAMSNVDLHGHLVKLLDVPR